jgi:hypothetical protein
LTAGNNFMIKRKNSNLHKVLAPILSYTLRPRHTGLCVHLASWQHYCCTNWLFNVLKSDRSSQDQIEVRS